MPKAQRPLDKEGLIRLVRRKAGRSREISIGRVSQSLLEVIEEVGCKCEIAYRDHRGFRYAVEIRDNQRVIVSDPANGQGDLFSTRITGFGNKKPTHHREAVAHTVLGMFRQQLGGNEVEGLHIVVTRR